MCGQAVLDKKYEKYAEDFASLKEGTCADQGYTVDDGSKDIKVPFIGDIKVALYSKTAAQRKADKVVDLWFVKATECGQIGIAKKYETYVEDFDKQLKEGTCADQGYTVEQAHKDVTVPFIGNIEVAMFAKSAVKAVKDLSMVDLYQVELGVCA